MRLLSMRTEDQDRAGIAVGNHALDLTAFFEIIEGMGEWIEGDTDIATFHHLEGIYRDALDIFRHGPVWLESAVSRLEANKVVWQQYRQKGVIKPLSEIRLNPPVVAPGKILAVGLNYADHASEGGRELPKSPLVFSKCTTALIGTGAAVRIPRISDQIDYEAELAVVIGKTARSVAADRALDYVAGYTILNDVTARDLQRTEKQWVRAKGLDTFAPCGPWLVTKEEIPDPGSLGIELLVNGQLRQRSNTASLIFSVSQLIAFISQDLTLQPGDIISTGTPSGVGVYMQPPVFLKTGDKIEITVEKIGTLQNYVE
jgi:2,4-didehydro-3-deoxy-L-rhamnonate hydrolase